MLKSWLIQNFKPILDSGELELAPVTVLAGYNSSGKSSLLQSILMIAQTLSSRILDRPLLPNGPIIQLGIPEDFLNHTNSSSMLTIGFELDLETEQEDSLAQNNVYARNDVYSFFLEEGLIQDANHIKLLATFDVASDLGHTPFNITLEKISLEFSSDPKFSFEDITIEPDKFQFVATKLYKDQLHAFLKNISPNYMRLVPYTGERPNYIGELKADNRLVLDPCLTTFTHFLPSRLIRKFSPEQKDKRGKKLRELTVQELITHNESEGLEIVADDADMLNLNLAVEKITRFFASQILYLGPIRDPQTSQAQKFVPSSELGDVGAKGEYSGIAYDVNQITSVEWYNPSTQQVEQGILKDALNSWVYYLGIASQVRTETISQSGINWQVIHKPGHKSLPLAAVGVGVSRILPILVMGLLAPRNTLLIIEEPELHLHPSVQARLGDFFMGLAKCGKQCLIETHSENLVSQLRYHIVQAGGLENSDCLIYFVDQDEQGAARFNPVEISPNGNILNWPDGFFDETMLQEDRITAASLKKRAKKAHDG